MDVVTTKHFPRVCDAHDFMFAGMAGRVVVHLHAARGRLLLFSCSQGERGAVDMYVLCPFLLKVKAA